MEPSSSPGPEATQSPEKKTPTIPQLKEAKQELSQWLEMFPAGSRSESDEADLQALAADIAEMEASINAARQEAGFGPVANVLDTARVPEPTVTVDTKDYMPTKPEEHAAEVASGDITPTSGGR